MTDWPKRLNRQQASSSLYEVHGIRRKPTTLAKYASIGVGPLYEKDRQTPLYRPDNLDKWAEQQLGP